MIDLGSWAETLGLRRKKTFVERVQDAAEDVVESVVDSMTPVLAKSAKMARSVRDIDLPEVRMPVMHRNGRSRMLFADLRRRKMPNMPKMGRREIRLPDVDLPRVHLPDMRLPDMRLPRAGELASDAAEFAGDAAERVRHTAATTGAAAAGVATGIGGFFGAIFSWLWSLTMFLVKAAILVGIAYAGWQWLQSRRTEQNWNANTSTPSDTNTYTSSVYGAVTGSDAPAAVGAR